MASEEKKVYWKSKMVIGDIKKKKLENPLGLLLYEFNEGVYKTCIIDNFGTVTKDALQNIGVEVEKVGDNELQTIRKSLKSGVTSCMEIKIKSGDEGVIDLKENFDSAKHVVLSGKADEDKNLEFSLEPFLDEESKKQFGKNAFTLQAKSLKMALILPNEKDSKDDIEVNGMKFTEIKDKKFVCV